MTWSKRRALSLKSGDRMKFKKKTSISYVIITKGTMFNTVSIKDLFTTNPSASGRRENQENDSGSNSQFPYSQVDFPDSQNDTQSHSQKSHSQTSDSPGKKFYQRYVSKGPLFPREGQSRAAPAKVLPQSYQQQMQMNKAKAKERDEMDMLTNMLSTVKECTTEVRQAVDAIKQNIDQGNASSEDVLTRYLDRIHEGISKYNDQLLCALGVRDEVKMEMTSLKTKLEEKEVRINELEKKLGDVLEEKQKNMTSEIVEMCQKQTEELREQLHELYSDHKKNLKEAGSRAEQNHRELLMHTQRQTQQAIEHTQSAVQLVHERIDGEMSDLSKKQKSEQSKLRQKCEEEVHRVQERHKTDVQILLKRQMDQLRSETDEKQGELMEKQQQQLMELHKRQRQDIQSFIKQQTSEFSDQQRNELVRIIEQLWRSEQQKSAAQQREQHQQLQSQMQKRYDDQIVEMRSRYRREVEEIQKQMQADTEISCRDESRLNHPARYTPSQDNTLQTQGRNRHISGSNAMQQNGSPHSYRPREEAYSPRPGSRSGFHQHEIESSERPASTCVTREAGPREATDVSEINTRLVMTPDLRGSSDWSQKYRPMLSPYSGIQTTKVSMNFSKLRSRSPTSGFVSPLTSLAKTWSTKTLFSKPSPSPVATVHPRVQPAGDIGSRHANHAYNNNHSQLQDSLYLSHGTESPQTRQQARLLQEESGQHQRRASSEPLGARLRSSQQGYLSQHEPEPPRRSCQHQPRNPIQEEPEQMVTTRALRSKQKPRGYEESPSQVVPESQKPPDTLQVHNRSSPCSKTKQKSTDQQKGDDEQESKTKTKPTSKGAKKRKKGNNWGQRAKKGRKTSQQQTVSCDGHGRNPEKGLEQSPIIDGNTHSDQDAKRHPIKTYSRPTKKAIRNSPPVDEVGSGGVLSRRKISPQYRRSPRLSQEVADNGHTRRARMSSELYDSQNQIGVSHVHVAHSSYADTSAHESHSRNDGRQRDVFEFNDCDEHPENTAGQIQKKCKQPPRYSRQLASSQSEEVNTGEMKVDDDRWAMAVKTKPPSLDGLQQHVGMLPPYSRHPMHDLSDSDSEAEGRRSQDSSPSLSIRDVLVKHISRKTPPIAGAAIAQTNIYSSQGERMATSMTSAQFYSTAELMERMFGFSSPAPKDSYDRRPSQLETDVLDTSRPLKRKQARRH